MKKSLRRVSRYLKNTLVPTQYPVRQKSIYVGVGVLVGVVMISLWSMHVYMVVRYRQLESPAIVDRHGMLLTLQPNSKGAYGRYVTAFPPRVKELLVQKEDRFFYWHVGVNPISTLRAAGRYAIGQRPGGASTITQQLAKNLLGNEQHRSFTNKIIETFAACSLELFSSKETILTMYANSVYMGNQVHGLAIASELYFNKKLVDLDDTKVTMLLATISSPSVQNPWREENARASRNLALRIGVAFDPQLASITLPHSYAPPRNFELTSMHEVCAHTCTATLDADLMDRLRTILDRHVQKGWDAGARSGAIVVIKVPENEILAIVGTPDVNGFKDGQQINMALEPRPIGSTAKPFIYLEGFRTGLRPYTLVNDREYKFPIGSGFPLYPKNYDGTYRGWVTLHAALSNSLNVPTVQVLRHIGLSNFYGFLQNSLGFRPLRDMDEYQYGIALGALEMDPLTLAQYLTIFPREGTLQPLRLFFGGTSTPYIQTPLSAITAERKVADPTFTQLVTAVLSDRLSGVQQFGLASSLNLSQSNYAVKTGTSQDYHDSWTVGYTPDFVVVVWFGDPDNTPLKHITGQSGAGGIWHDAMELLMSSPYNKRTPFDLSRVQRVAIDGSSDIGVMGDVVAEHRHALPDDDLVVSPQEGDTFLYEAGMTIPLVSARAVSWHVNNEFLGEGQRVSFMPMLPGNYTITATALRGESQSVHLRITAQR